MGIIKILMIDDEEGLSKLVKLNLEMTGDFEVITAPNGKQGIDLAKEIKPDLILLDILMPDMDGFETLERLKKDDDTAKIPVIILSAKGDAVSMDKVRNLCGELYVSKPIEAEDLKAKIEKILKRRA
jgi:two-component system alkaline phosphatase synthesis response regulator PhoP